MPDGKQTHRQDIHPTAIVAGGAELGEGVWIGPYCVIGPDVRLHAGVRLESHVAVAGRTEIGAETRIYPFASIGHAPQDLKYRGEPSRLVIGARCQIREGATVNPGTEGGGMVTSIGDDCLLMAGAHVAHDCIVGNHVIFANNATLGGHVVVGDGALFGGLSAVRQFVRIGEGAMVGGMSGVERDVIPFGLVMGDRARLAGLNLVGLERRGLAATEIQDMRAAYHALFEAAGTFAARLEDVSAKFQHNAHVRQMLDFVRTRSKLGLCQPSQANAA